MRTIIDNRRSLLRSLLLVGLTFSMTGCTSTSRNACLSIPGFGGWKKEATAQEVSQAPTARIAKSSSEVEQVHASETAEGISGGIEGEARVKLVAFEDLQIVDSSTPEVAPGTAVPGASGGSYLLEHLETLALQNSPTLRQLELSASKAAGFRTQVGLRPNSSIGYSGQQLDDAKTDQHSVFLERELVTGKKLELNESVLNATVRGQLREVDAQRNRILADVKTAYTQLMAEKAKVQMLSDFTAASDKAVELTELRREAKEGSQIDVLQARTQANQVRLQLDRSMALADGYARELAALTGLPNLTAADVGGVLHADAPEIDWDATLAELRQLNPEYQVALANLERALANWRRQNAQVTPNLTFQIGAGVDRATDHGMINTQLSAPLMIQNRNQGNISAAQADYCMAQVELERVDRALRARVAKLSGIYDSAKVQLLRFRNNLLPDIQQALDLSHQAYVAGETDFLEVLIVRRTYFELRLQAIEAERDTILAEVNLENFGLNGALDPINDQSGDASLRDLAFGQQ